MAEIDPSADLDHKPLSGFQVSDESGHDNLQRAQKIRYKNVSGGDEVTNGQAISLTDSTAQWCK